MKQWIADPVMGIEITTDWKVGSQSSARGRHNQVDFENKGIVLRFEPHSILRYSHLSSIFRLPDKGENYTIIGFRLTQAAEHSTSLIVNTSNFPGESGFEHWQYYWRVRIEVLKRFMRALTKTPSPRTILPCRRETSLLVVVSKLVLCGSDAKFRRADFTGTAGLCENVKLDW
jgi:hypothetical protein